MIGKKRVVVGLSGGVDSSVAAALLIERGYEVSGVYLECYNEPGCRTDQDKADALKVALKLGIPFQVLDFRKEYKERVIEYFYREYEAGRTPNPDVMCNREVKFGIFYDWALRQAQGKPGFDYVATGHYARIKQFTNSNLQFTSKENFHLQRAKDESKDQSYFLWQIPQDHLEHILFPLGEMQKSEVRAKAKELNLVTASKPDSMGICFIGDVNVSNLLEKRLGENLGEVLYQGKVVGSHRGLWFYTIGERSGFDLDKAKMKKMGMHPEKMPPLYVIGKNKEKNQLIVGEREETMTRHFMAEFTNSNLQFTNKWVHDGNKKLFVRIRNLGELYEVVNLKIVNCKLEIETAMAVFGVAEGQSCVFYDEDKVLVGGSIIV
ncbi:tRNA 2-thiouridine(34) synthase MnmA [Candidatus Woesebacteria bacterium]|nr:tRNA 2-thiouridine(34) synthase MnmA [Candidatus Woesebacteria bacterium]